jgi:hypothetical protein
MKERRTLERFKLRLPAKIEILSGSQGAEKPLLKLFTSNICREALSSLSRIPRPRERRLR